jgi:TolB-like protein
MRKLLLLLLVLSSTRAICQDSYETKIEKLAKDIFNTFLEGKMARVCLSTFLYNETQTKFTKLVYEDLSNELVAINASQPKILLINNTKTFSSNDDNNTLSESEKALLLGKEKKVDYVITGKIVDNENGYKLQIRLIETNEGNLSNAFKTTIDKTNNIEILNANIIGQQHETILAKAPDKKIEEPELIALYTEARKKEKPVEEPKPKKKREGKFWKALGNIAVAAIETTATAVIEKNKQAQTNNGSASQEQTNTSTNSAPSQSETTNNNGNGNSTTGSSTYPTNDNSNTTSSSEAPCKAYINIVNKTENDISVYIYNENPVGNPVPKLIYKFTIAVGKAKKQRIDKDVNYFYTATNNTGGPIFGGYKDYSGTFEVEACDATVEEEIQ